MSERKSFIIHKDSLEILDKLTNEQAGELIKAIKAYQFNEAVDVSDLIDLVFTPFKKQFERDSEKYEKLCEKNRLIAVKRHSTKSTTGTSGNQSLPRSTKSTDNKSDSKNDSKSKSKNKRFTKPTIEELKSYIKEKQYIVDGEIFYNHYESNGWMVGKNKMKSWKASCRTWHLKNKPKETNIKPIRKEL